MPFLRNVRMQIGELLLLKEYAMSLFLNGQHVIDFDQNISALSDHRWYPVYCRPNKEKMFFEASANRGIPCYMPEIMRHRVTRGKRVLTPVPMFTGYVFACTNRQQNWAVKQSKYVLRVLPVEEYNEQQLISELNIVRIFENLARTNKVEIHPEFVPGKKVVISQGKLQGIEGIVVQRKNEVEIIVKLDFLGYSLATIEAYDMELA